MANIPVTSADKQSIFGDTYDGVVSPLVAHEHPYPTRFHGPIYHYPRFFRPYRQQSFMVPGNWLNPKISSGLGASEDGNASYVTKAATLLAATAAGYLIFGKFFAYKPQRATPNLKAKTAKRARAKRTAKKTRQPRCEDSTRIQSLTFDRAMFTPATAKAWAKRHGFKAAKVDEERNTLRIRQEDPKLFRPDLFRVISFRPGVQATIACPR